MNSLRAYEHRESQPFGSEIDPRVLLILLLLSAAFTRCVAPEGHEYQEQLEEMAIQIDALRERHEAGDLSTTELSGHLTALNCEAGIIWEGLEHETECNARLNDTGLTVLRDIRKELGLSLDMGITPAITTTEETP